MARKRAEPAQPSPTLRSDPPPHVGSNIPERGDVSACERLGILHAQNSETSVRTAFANGCLQPAEADFQAGGAGGYCLAWEFPADATREGGPSTTTRAPIFTR